MGMGFAPTWLRQVSPLLHMTNHCVVRNICVQMGMYLCSVISRPQSEDWLHYEPFFSSCLSELLLIFLLQCQSRTRFLYVIKENPKFGEL